MGEAKRWTDEQERQLNKLLRAGHTTKEIARQMGKTYSAVKNKIGRESDCVLSEWEPREIELLREMIKSGHTASEIMRKLRKRAWDVHGKAAELGLTIRRRKTEQPCWSCKHATNKYDACPWTDGTFREVPGWKAVRIQGGAGTPETYDILECPIYEEG